MRKVIVTVIVWTGLVTALHLRLNVDWAALLNDRLPPAERKLEVGYLPVT